MTCEMAPGERVVCCLTGRPVDRVPFGVSLGWLPWGETLERWRNETGLPDLDPARELGYDLSFALPDIEHGPWPHFQLEVLQEDERFVISRDSRGIVMRNRRDGHSMPEFLSHPVQSRGDWEQIRAERLRIDDASRIRENWPAFRRRIAQTGEAVQVGWFPWGVFGTVRDLMGAETLLFALYEQPDLVADIMQHLTSLWIALWQRVADEVQIDHIHIWEDMAGRHGSLISPAMVQRFMVPCYDRIAQFARAAGARIVSVDSDGDVRQLVPVMTRHGINAMLPFEVQAGCDILRYREQYPELGIMGGLDKRALATGCEGVEAEVSRAATMCRSGRYIPAFDHLIPPDVPWTTFEHAAHRLREVCRTCAPCNPLA